MTSHLCLLMNICTYKSDLEFGINLIDVKHGHCSSGDLCQLIFQPKNKFQISTVDARVQFVKVFRGVNNIHLMYGPEGNSYLIT